MVEQSPTRLAYHRSLFSPPSQLPPGPSGELHTPTLSPARSIRRLHTLDLLLGPSPSCLALLHPPSEWGAHSSLSLLWFAQTTPSLASLHSSPEPQSWRTRIAFCWGEAGLREENWDFLSFFFFVRCFLSMSPHLNPANISVLAAMHFREGHRLQHAQLRRGRAETRTQTSSSGEEGPRFFQEWAMPQSFLHT